MQTTQLNVNAVMDVVLKDWGQARVKTGEGKIYVVDSDTQGADLEELNTLDRVEVDINLESARVTRLRKI